MSKKVKSYEELKEVWYDKLERKGFIDIEQDEYRIKGNMSSDIFSRSTGRSASSLTPIARAAKRDYYIMAEHFLNSHTFESRLDEIIWAYHTEDISERDIVKLLNKVRKKKIYKLKVGKTIRRLKAIMFILNGVTK